MFVCSVSDTKVLAVFVEAIFLWMVLICVCMEVCPSTTLPINVRVKSSLTDTESSSVFNDDLFVAFKGTTILCILSSSVFMRVKSVFMTDTVEVALKSCIFEDCFGDGRGR